MNLEEIKERASKENIDLIDNYIDTIKKEIILHPNGCNLSFPHHVINDIIKKCDSLNIPVYHVTEDFISIARTYSHLYAFQLGR